VVNRVEKSKVLMEDTWEKDLDFRLSKIVFHIETMAKKFLS
jgi:hypothetical protein